MLATVDMVTTDQYVSILWGRRSACIFSVTGNQINLLLHRAVVDTFAAGGTNQMLAFSKWLGQMARSR